MIIVEGNMRATLILLVGVLTVHTHAATTHFVTTGAGKVEQENFSCILQCFKQPLPANGHRELLVPCVSNCLQQIVDALREWLNQFPETEDTMKRRDHASLYRQGVAIQKQLISLKKVVDMPSRFWSLMSLLPHPLPTFPNLLQPLHPIQPAPPFLPTGFSSPMPGNLLGQLIQLFRNILDEIIRRQQGIIHLLIGCEDCDDTNSTMSTTTTPGTSTTAPTTVAPTTVATTTVAPVVSRRSGVHVVKPVVETVKKPVVRPVVDSVVDFVVSPVVVPPVKPVVDFVVSPVADYVVKPLVPKLNTPVVEPVVVEPVVVEPVVGEPVVVEPVVVETDVKQPVVDFVVRPVVETIKN